MFFKWVDPPYPRMPAEALPYIKGLTEPLTHVIDKPLKMLQQEFLVPKFSLSKEKLCNVAHKIPCATCIWIYTGETGRSFVTRKKKHSTNVKSCTKGCNIARNHAWFHDHCIDFHNASIIDTGSYRVRKTWESWHTAFTNEADNNSCL